MGKDHQKYNTQFFKKWARFYDWTIHLFGVSKIRETVADLYGSSGKKIKILDICTGTGGQALALGKRGFNVIGIDSSEDMLKIAKRKNHYQNVHFEIANSSKIPYGDSAFDGSVVSFGLHEMPKAMMQKTIEEMSRVTKKGGKIVVADYGIAKNRLVQWFAFHFCNLFESKYFPSFFKIDLNKTLEVRNIQVTKTLNSHFGFLRILDCENRK